MMRFRWSLLLFLLFAPLGATAAETKLLAVLPLDVRDAHLDVATQHALEESIRTVSGDALSSQGWVVLTGETTLAVLHDNGIEAEKACEASCALAAARELKAKIFISGTVAKSEGTYIAFVRLFENSTGSQIGSASVEGETIREVRKAFEAKAHSFFARVLKDHDWTPPPPPSVPVVRPESAPDPVAVAPSPVPLPPAAVEEPVGPAAKPASAGKVVGIIATIVGGLALAGGATFAVITQGQKTDLRTNPRSLEQAQTLLQTTNQSALMANVLLVAGGVCAVGGVTMTVVF